MNAIIIDEAHRIKNERFKIIISIENIKSNIDYY